MKPESSGLLNPPDPVEKTVDKIHATAPLRINDLGGWTDTWFSEEGHVLNMAVSPCVEVDISVSQNREWTRDHVRVHAVDYGEVFHINPKKPDFTKHPLIQGAVTSLPVPKEKKLDISIRSFFPAGSAVGTSASICVALLGALDALFSKRRSAGEISALAHQVETEKMHQQSGIQDQICAAYGGVCDIRIPKYPEVRVSNLSLSNTIWEDLNRQMCLIYLGSAHRSSEIHECVIESLKKGGSRIDLLKELRFLAEEGRNSLLSEDLVQFGRVMVNNNELQRALHPDLISSAADAVIKIAEKYGALGWKVNGAGGQGGSITVLSSQDNASRLRMITEIQSLEHGIRLLPVCLSSEGLSVWD
jgi:D-glycero-alpha-D-manno-heptose-7-phosphate kinase